MYRWKISVWACVLGSALVLTRLATGQRIGDGPAIPYHLSQTDIEDGRLSFAEVVQHGDLLFNAVFNKYDGQGRPATTGSGAARIYGSAPAMLRTSGPDASSCAGCHNQPRAGGAGDFVANVFVLAQVLDPVTESVSGQFSNERNTLGMMGAGPIEMLAREMTEDLLGIRNEAIVRARANSSNVTVQLITKGIHFGSITAAPGSAVDTSQVRGVNKDLIVRPFHQKGAVVSLREFSNNAMNHHHGMQAMERFGVARTGASDFDEDGVPDELTVGDITAVTIFQAALPVPGRMISRAKADAINRGELIFNAIGCAGCHPPVLVLNNPVFCEPNPLNPPGTFKDTTQSFCFDLTREGPAPRLEATVDGKALVRAFTDLRRHRICDDQDPHFCNERLLPPGGRKTTAEFLSRKLWDVGNSAPYGHRGDLSTIAEAILAHGAEGRAAKLAFQALLPQDQANVILFLKSLQVLPEGSDRVVLTE